MLEIIQAWKVKLLPLRGGLRKCLAGLALALIGLLPSTAPAVEGADAPSDWATVLTSGRVLVLGDSITQDGRYVSFLEYYLTRLGPSAHHDIISIGLSAETLSGLSEKSHPFPRPCALERLDRALTATAPRTVIACYGMNDGIYHPLSPEQLAAFKAGLHQLIQKVRATGARLVLVTPPVFDSLPIRTRTVAADAPDFGYSSPFVDYDRVLGEFAAAERAVNESGVMVIDLHSTMSTALGKAREHDPAFTFAPDGVHPGDAGHLLMAQTILESLGQRFPHSDTDLDLVHVQHDPIYVHVHERRQLRSEAWLPFVGYQRGEKFKSASVAAAEKVVARLQNEIDAVATSAELHR